jgi:hypothetical protein
LTHLVDTHIVSGHLGTAATRAAVILTEAIEQEIREKQGEAKRLGFDIQ